LTPSKHAFLSTREILALKVGDAGNLRFTLFSWFVSNVFRFNFTLVSVEQTMAKEGSAPAAFSFLGMERLLNGLAKTYRRTKKI